MHVPRDKILEPFIARAVTEDSIDTMSEPLSLRVLEVTALCRIADSLHLVANHLEDIHAELTEINLNQ